MIALYSKQKEKHRKNTIHFEFGVNSHHPFEMILRIWASSNIGNSYPVEL